MLFFLILDQATGYGDNPLILLWIVSEFAFQFILVFDLVSLGASKYFFEKSWFLVLKSLVWIKSKVEINSLEPIIFNLLYKISKKEDVIHFSAVVTFIRGAAILLGGILAGLIVESNYINQLGENFNLTPIHISMMISIFLRFLSIPILKKINI